MPNDLPEIGLCPHCGAEATLAVGFPKHKVGREFVTETLNWMRCKGCGATGGTGRNALEAIEKWNRRVAKDEEHHIQESAGLVSGDGGVREGEGATDN